MGKLAEWIEKQYGIRTRLVENPVRKTVGTTAAMIARNNPDRFAIIIINLSANTLYVAFDSEVSSTKGIRLGANGGSYTLIAEEDLELTAHELWAIATGINSAIYVAEVVVV